MSAVQGKGAEAPSLAVVRGFFDATVALPASRPLSPNRCRSSQPAATRTIPRTRPGGRADDLRGMRR